MALIQWQSTGKLIQGLLWLIRIQQKAYHPSCRLHGHAGDFNCLRQCNDALHWVGIDILVDPAGATGETSAAPSNSDNALCFGNDTPSDFLFGSGDGWASTTSQATTLLSNTGVHTVRVRVNGAASGVARLGDMSLIV